MKALCKLKKKNTKKYKEALLQFSHKATYICSKCNHISCDKKVLCKAEKI